jgi:hypothetical protein
LAHLPEAHFTRQRVSKDEISRHTSTNQSPASHPFRMLAVGNAERHARAIADDRAPVDTEPGHEETPQSFGSLR